MGSHESVVVSQDGSHFTTVELGLEADFAVPNNIYITPKVAPYTRSTEKLDERGKVRTAFRDLFCLHLKVRSTCTGLITPTAFVSDKVRLQVLIEFGSYFVIKKNCQLFCTLYLKELGLPVGVLREDTDKAVAVGLVVLAAVGIVYAYRMKSA